MQRSHVWWWPYGQKEYTRIRSDPLTTQDAAAKLTKQGEESRHAVETGGAPQ